VPFRVVVQACFGVHLASAAWLSCLTSDTSQNIRKTVAWLKLCSVAEKRASHAQLFCMVPDELKTRFWSMT
jgi:hypothetical protein